MASICSVGSSYLLLTDRLHPPKSLIPGFRMYCYSAKDTDEVTVFLTKAPFVDTGGWRWVSVRGTLHLLLLINGDFDGRKLTPVLFSYPFSNFYLSLAPSLLSQSLPFLQSLLPLLCTHYMYSWTLHLIIPDSHMREDMVDFMRKTGYLPPKTFTNTEIDAGSLLNSYLNALKCAVCRRIVTQPYFHNNQVKCYCHVSVDGDIAPVSEDYAAVLRDIGERLEVVCRCGVRCKGGEYDRHLTRCEKKTWTCGEHKFNGPAEDMFEHYLQLHWGELSLALPQILSPQ